MRATEPIASSFWVNAFSQPYFEIVLADDHQSIAATKGGGQLYRAILLKESDVRRAWPQRRKIAAKPTKISSVVNALRLTIAAETLAMKAL